MHGQFIELFLKQDHVVYRKPNFLNSGYFLFNFAKKEIVCDRNQVLVSGTETKVQFRYQCISQTFFLPKPKLFFSRIFKNILMFPTS